jgi:hypothetical protein
MRVDVTPLTAEVVPGQPLFLTVMITNTSTVIGGYLVRLLGADPGWVEFDGEQVSLFPEEVRVLTVSITPPKGIPAGVRRIAVQVRELTPPEDSTITEVDLTVPAAKSLQVRADPLAVTAGKRAGFSIIAENTGNTMIAGRLAGDDPEGKVKFAFEPEIVTLQPGEHAVIDMRARARRHFTGSPAVRQLGVYLDDAPAGAFFTEPEPDDVKGARGEAAAVAQATFIQKSVLSRGALSLVGLLIAVTVFALVITMALGRLVGQTTADRDLALQVAAARNGGAATGTSGVAGTVKLLTNGKGLSAVAVSVFDASDTTKPLVTTATDKSGAYTVGQLAAGKYKLSFKRAGYVALWYPAATSDADATTVEVKPGEQKHGVDVSLGGVPASISGTVVGDDVSAATLYLETVPGGTSPRAPTTNAQSVAPLPAADPGSATPAPNPLAGGTAIVQKAPVGADGTFTLTNVPSPSVYELVVVKTGYATTTQELDVAGGETRTGVQLNLRKGDGLITGTVTDPSGPQGNATITATSGQTTLTTVSLTDAGKKGQFTLRGLPTPGSFTLTATLANHASQTLSLTLASGQKLTGVQITLNTSSGSLDGVVEAPAETTALQSKDKPAAGVTVTATNGLLTVQSETESRGQVGHWHIGGLPVPGTYTLTFARTDLTAQTVSVSLDANGKPSVGANVDATGVVRVTMQSATLKVSGKVWQICGSSCSDGFHSYSAGQKYGLGEATVTLNSGSTTYTVTTASTPTSADVGTYRIDNLPPGTYTRTITADGGFGTNSQVITLADGVVYPKDVTLSSPAAIKGILVGTDGKALTDWTVYLYQAEKYPSAYATSVTTDSTTGAFTISGVDPGKYLLAFSPTPDPSAAVKTKTVMVQPGESQDLHQITVNWQS